MTKLSLLFLLFMTGACIKTAEQLQREKRMDTISDQVSDSQGLMAEVVTQLKDMQSQLDKMNGRLEEIEHRQKQVNTEDLNAMKETVTLLKEQKEVDSTNISQIQNELKEQRAFIEKVTISLSSLGQSKSTAIGKKKSVKEELKAALVLVKKNKYAKARTELETYIDHKELSSIENNKVLHGLGRIEFFTKNYDKALTYFSKIYSKYPKSTLAPNSLHFIGKTLQKMSRPDEAKAAFSKLVEDYPETKEAKEAKQEL